MLYLFGAKVKYAVNFLYCTDLEDTFSSSVRSRCKMSAIIYKFFPHYRVGNSNFFTVKL